MTKPKPAAVFGDPPRTSGSTPSFLHQPIIEKCEDEAAFVFVQALILPLSAPASPDIWAASPAPLNAMSPLQLQSEHHQHSSDDWPASRTAAACPRSASNPSHHLGCLSEACQFGLGALFHRTASRPSANRAAC